MTSWLTLRVALHDLDLEGKSWVQALHAECRALFDEGLGTFVYAYRFGQSPAIRLTELAGRETAPGFWQALEAWGAANATVLARSYQTGHGSLGHFERAAIRAGAAISNPHLAFEPHGVTDVFTLVGHDPSGFGLFVTVPRARAITAPSRPEHRALERLALELGVATRLREHRRQAYAARLSTAEARVVRLLLDGASDKCIAAELGVTVSTVSTFLQRVRRKLGCRPGQERLRMQVCTSSLQRRLDLFGRLTDAECDVAAELLVGATYDDISKRRGVSVQTVASQCARVFRKCGVSGQRELAAALL